VAIPVGTFHDLPAVVQKQNEIGWQSLLVGWPSLGWSEVQQRYYEWLGSRRSGLRWLTALIQKVWDIAWDVWDNRNRVLQETNITKYKSLCGRPNAPAAPATCSLCGDGEELTNESTVVDAIGTTCQDVFDYSPFVTTAEECDSDIQPLAGMCCLAPGETRKPTVAPTLSRANDQLLIPLFHETGIRDDQLHRLNLCWLFPLQVLTISDITTGCGTKITTAAWNGDRDTTRTSCYQWPTQGPPSIQDWIL
jgi:hypothetical protein